MSTHNIPFINIKKENHPKLSQICIGRVFSQGLKNEFETAVVNEPSVFEPLKFHCIGVTLGTITETKHKPHATQIENNT